MVKLLWVCFLILFIGFSSAEVVANFDAYYGIIEDSGAITTTSTSVSGFDVVGYTCANSGCTNIGSRVSGLSASTGSSNIRVTFPTVLASSYGYVLYFYKDGYIGMEGTGVKVSGSGSWDGPNIYLYKKRSGWAPIMNLDVVDEVSPNTPIEIDFDVEIDASTYAAIEDSRTSNVPLNEDVKTLVTLKILNDAGSVIHSDSKTLYLDYSGQESVSFDYSGFSDVGDYEVVLYTSVAGEAKILNSVTQTASVDVSVVGEDDYWYSLLKGLKYSPTKPYVGNRVAFDVDYISGYMDPLGDLTEVDGLLDVKFYRDGSLVRSRSYSLNGDGDERYDMFSFDEIFDVAGNYVAVLTATPESGSSGADVLDSTVRVSFVVKGYACSSDSDCGGDYAKNELFCSGGDVWDYFVSPKCMNGGTSSAYCSSSVFSDLIESCSYGCSGGACISQNDIDCFSDSDCGGDYAKGELFCSGGNVWDYFVSPKCMNGGTSSAYCSSSVFSDLIESCSYGCSGGACTEENGSNETVLAIYIYSPVDGETYDEKNIDLIVGSNKNVSSWIYSLDGGANVSFSENVSIFAREGRHNIVVWGMSENESAWGSSSFEVELDDGDDDNSKYVRDYNDEYIEFENDRGGILTGDIILSYNESGVGANESDYSFVWLFWFLLILVLFVLVFLFWVWVR
jgi:hypothetical protein